MADDCHSKNQDWTDISFSLADALRDDNVDKFLQIYDELLPKGANLDQIEQIKEKARILSEMDEESYQSQRRSNNTNNNSNKNNHSNESSSSSSFPSNKSKIHSSSNSNSSSKNNRSINENWREASGKDSNNWRNRSSEHSMSSSQSFGKSSDRQRDERNHRKPYGSGSNEHKPSPDKRPQSRNKPRRSEYSNRSKSGRGNRGHKDNSMDGTHRTSSPSPSRTSKIEHQESNQLDNSTSRSFDEARQTITKEPPFGFPPSESQLLRASTELLPKPSMQSIDDCSEGHNLESNNDSIGQLETTGKNEANPPSGNDLNSEKRIPLQDKSSSNSFMHKEAADYLYREWSNSLKGNIDKYIAENDDTDKISKGRLKEHHRGGSSKNQRYSDSTNSHKLNKATSSG